MYAFSIKTACLALLVGASVVLLPGCVSEQLAEPGLTEEPAVEKEAVIPEKEEFIVTEELYAQTFEDIESLIKMINSVVIRQDYDTWLSYLTDDYMEYHSDPAFLGKISEDLTKALGFRVRLRSLQDYFRYIVVNSRVDVNLDRIVFLDEHRIAAEAIINETPYILYYLEKEDNEWRIGKW